MKNLLGILLLAFITTVGFSGAVAAADGFNGDHNGLFLGNHGNVLWSGDMNTWRGSWFWRHNFFGNDFFFRGHHFRKEFRHDRFGHTIIVIVGTPGILPL